MAGMHTHFGGPQMPKGVEVASFTTYDEAQTAVASLADCDFDIRHLTIVGQNLHMVDKVAGRMTIAAASRGGASSGAIWGALFGMFMHFNNMEPRNMPWLFIGAAVGLLVGMMLSALRFVLSRGRPGFKVMSYVVAGSYVVLADSDVDRAFDLLQRAPGNLTRPQPRRERVESTGPTEYGSRPDEQPRFGVRLGNGAQTSGQNKAEVKVPADETSAIEEASVVDSDNSIEEPPVSGYTPHH